MTLKFHEKQKLKFEIQSLQSQGLLKPICNLSKKIEVPYPHLLVVLVTLIRLPVKVYTL